METSPILPTIIPMPVPNIRTATFWIFFRANLFSSGENNLSVIFDNVNNIDQIQRVDKYRFDNLIHTYQKGNDYIEKDIL